jgi:hypothetical protein
MTRDVEFKHLVRKVNNGVLEYSRSEIRFLLNLSWLELKEFISIMKDEGVLVESTTHPSYCYVVNRNKLYEFIAKSRSKR